MATELIYKGIAFPFAKGEVALPASVGDDELIKQNLIQLVMTLKSERVMRPNLGSLAQSYVFENTGFMLDALISTEISAVIAAGEPRVIVRRVAVQTEDDDSVVATIYYYIPATNTYDQVSVTLS